MQRHAGFAEAQAVTKEGGHASQIRHGERYGACRHTAIRAGGGDGLIGKWVVFHDFHVNTVRGAQASPAGALTPPMAR